MAVVVVIAAPHLYMTANLSVVRTEGVVYLVNRCLSKTFKVNGRVAFCVRDPSHDGPHHSGGGFSWE